ncbi:MAG: VanZ family protein [Bacilli bacterium]|jgi:uncharacterized protein YjdB
MKKLLSFIKKRLNYLVLASFILINGFTAGQALLSSSESAEVSGAFSNFLSAFFHMIGPVEADLVLPEAIDISGPDLVVIGQSKRLAAAITPSDTTDQSVYWSSSDSNILEVTSGGIVVAKGLGAATIRATSSEDEVYDETSIQVIDFPAVSSFEFDEAVTDIYVGTSTTISLQDVAPDLARLDTIEWTSDDEGVAQVNQYGVVKGTGVGTANITAASGTFDRTIAVTVTASSAPVIAPSELSISGETEGYIYRYTQLEADFGDTPPTDASITWLSSDINVARVDSGGKVYGYKFAGTVTITAISNVDDTLTDSIVMTFSKVYPETVTLTSAKAEIIAGQTQRIDFTFDPVDTYDRQLIWVSSDPEVASISSHGEYGLLTAKKMGTVTISAHSVMDETVAATIAIKVLKASTLNDEQEADMRNFVRKGVGHYSLFMVNGLLGYLTFYYFLKGKKRHYRYLLASLGLGLPLAVGMEALQFFANGRSPLLTDAIINFLGYLTANIVLFIVFVAVQAKKSRFKIIDAPE